MDKETAVGGNIEMAFDLLAAQIADPALLGDIPHGVHVVLIPEDNPALAAHNMALVPELVARGHNVYIKRVGTTCVEPAVAAASG